MTRRRFIQSLAGIPASACFGGFAIPALAATVRKVALVVGNAGYAGTERLKNPVADATLTANTLRKLGFHTSLATDRNTAQLKADLDAFGQAARGADIAVFFYAGHGIAVENINYLLAVDQKLATATSLDMKRQGISLRWIESLLRQDMGVSVIVVDACRNPLLRGVPQQGMAAAPRAARGMLTFYSTAPGALARDGTGANSDFSSVFNRHLARPDLSLKQIVEATQRDVSAETGDTQVPWVSSGLVGDAHLASTEQVGVADRALNLAVDYTKERQQFGQAVASFQGVKHRAAQILVKVETARSAVYAAAFIADTAGDATDLTYFAAQARTDAAEAALFSTRESIQLHGGVGFTWEFDPHLFFRRAQAASQRLGTVEQWREQVAARLLDESVTEAA